MQMIRDATTILYRLRVRGGKVIRGQDLRWTIDAGTGLDISTVAGGITAQDDSALTLTINSDNVVFNASFASSAPTVVSVGGTSTAMHYVFAYGTLNPLTISISPVTTATAPVHAVNQWRRALYEVYVSSGSIIVNRIMHLGLIDLTSFYGP